MTRAILYLLTLLLGIVTTNAQQITGQIIDSETKESIPFATIRVGEMDLISNNDGYFTLSGENTNETAFLSVSFIGYVPQSVSVIDLKSNNNIISLTQASYDLGGIYVSNIKPDPNEIMKSVNERFSENYGDFDYKYRIFTRENTTFKPKILEVDIKKSTGFSKSELKEANDEVEKFTNALIKHPVQEFTDVLLDYYVTSIDVEGKKGRYSKANVIKGVVMKDKNRSTSFDDIENSSLNLLTKHLDTTKFYRIKSGLIGSRDTISFSEEYNRQQDEKRRKKHNINAPEHKNLSNVKGRVTHITQSKSNLKNSRFLFINKPELYNYSYVGATYMNDLLVYVLEFNPKKSKAKHIGKIYVSEEDFAVLRVDYTLAEGKKMGGINLKLLLGVKVFENVHQGTLIFKKNPNSGKYYLHYTSQEEGQYFYINRPLKLIEINKNRKERELLSFNIKVEGNTNTKTEYLNMEVQPVDKSTLDAVQEKDFKYQTLKKYDPNIWKGYNVIEPLEEMKKFEVVE